MTAYAFARGAIQMSRGVFSTAFTLSICIALLIAAVAWTGMRTLLLI